MEKYINNLNFIKILKYKFKNYKLHIALFVGKFELHIIEQQFKYNISPPTFFFTKLTYCLSDSVLNFFIYGLVFCSKDFGQNFIQSKI